MTINFIANIDPKQHYVHPTFLDEKFTTDVAKSFVHGNNTKSKNVLLMSRKMREKWSFKGIYQDTIIFFMSNNFCFRYASLDNKKVYYLNFIEFERLYSRFNLNVFVLGGKSMFDYFIRKFGAPSNVFLSLKKQLNIDYCLIDDSGNKFDYIDDNYNLVYCTEEIQDTRYLRYRHDPTNNKKHDNKYFDIIKNVLDKGKARPDRTQTGVYSVFGEQKRFDISNSLPILTTKKIPFRLVIEELLWICRGDTDAKILSKSGVKIWDKNTSIDFLRDRGLPYEEGILGPGYGWQLRHCGFEYDESYADTKKLQLGSSGIDQLESIVHLLKTDPFSRRIFASYWNPVDLNKMALLPCHVTFQFYVHIEEGVKRLSCHFTMRSSDVFLGLPFNLVFYALLTHIIAMKTDMVPHELIYTGGDVHIYQNHLDQVSLQIERTPRPPPMVKLDPSIKLKNWEHITSKDFELIGYYPHPEIKANMAV